MKFVKQLSRSIYGFRYSVKGSFNLGEICPIGAPIEVVPGDEFKADCAMVIRMATPIAPIMDDLDAEVTAHFVPLRLVSTKYGDLTNSGTIIAGLGGTNLGNFPTFEQIIGNGLGNPADWTNTDHELYQAPTANWNAASAKAAGYTTIGEALGLGLGIGNTSKTQEILAYPLYGYNLIYQERFRNQDVETAKPTLGQGSNLYGVSGSNTATSGTDATYNHALSVAYKHGDYFTNAKPAPTKGGPVEIPLGELAPVTTINPAGTSAETGHYALQFRDISDGAVGSTGSLVTSLGIANIDPNVTPVTSEPVYPANLAADLSKATAATINSFITSFNVQRLLMNDIKGTRYFDIIKNHYGIENEDIRLYIPELLNIRRFSINISPVIQQSGSAAATSSTDQPNYLGTTGGYSFTANNGAMVRHAFGEFGYIYFLIVIRQRHTYGQGIPKMFLRSTRFDFFFPELGRIGYQKVDNIELDAIQTKGGTFGYVPAWEELRIVNQSQAFGFLNPSKENSLDYWTLTEELTALPQLEMAFLKENRANLARALTIGATGPDFVMDAMIYGKKATLVPIGSDPKLFN